MWSKPALSDTLLPETENVNSGAAILHCAPGASGVAHEHLDDLSAVAGRSGLQVSTINRDLNVGFGLIGLILTGAAGIDGTGGGGDNSTRILRGRSSGNHTDLVLHERNVGHEVDN